MSGAVDSAGNYLVNFTTFWCVSGFPFVSLFARLVIVHIALLLLVPLSSYLLCCSHFPSILLLLFWCLSIINQSSHLLTRLYYCPAKLVTIPISFLRSFILLLFTSAIILIQFFWHRLHVACHVTYCSVSSTVCSTIYALTCIHYSGVCIIVKKASWRHRINLVFRLQMGQCFTVCAKSVFRNLPD